MTDKIRLQADTGNDTMHSETLKIHTDLREPLKYPAYLPGYRSHEIMLGHHDPQTDIFLSGACPWQRGNGTGPLRRT
ncbi:hypothetical protein ACQ86N_45275 [Puia sp. P3]|uniref:hypothetical protein n=1 Tax=Puia sp. P3 TaxID=3423952 RepID=UPI003D665136